jgi:hypothetical protein
MNIVKILSVLILLSSLVLLVIDYSSNNTFDELRDSTISIKGDIDLLKKDYESKTQGYSFVTESMIMKYSKLVENDSLRSFLLAHKGQSEYFSGYIRKLEIGLENMELRTETMTNRQRSERFVLFALLFMSAFIVYRLWKK